MDSGVPIIGAKPADTRSDERKAQDQILAAKLAQLALEANEGNVRLAAFVFVVGDETQARSHCTDNIEHPVRGEFAHRVEMLGHMLRTSETNYLMSRQPGGAPRQLPS